MTVVAVGRMKAGAERDLASRYFERARLAGRALGFSDVALVELAESRVAEAAARRAAEARAIDKHRSGVTIALDEGGVALGSVDFARRLAHWRDQGTAAVTFVIGGADGLDPALVARADLSLSLSAMTWPHQMARILLVEQLYRATTILAGHPYHRE